MKNEKIYILVYYSYDYYEFKDIIAVSFTKKALVEKYNEINKDNTKLYIPPMIPHTEECHYTIEEYKILRGNL